MYRCLRNQAGEGCLHRQMQAAPEPFLKALAPYPEALGVGVEGLCTGSWLADLCASAGMPCGLGPARSLQAIHGGQATNDRRDAHHMAVRLRGGLLPQASVDSAERRAI